MATLQYLDSLSLGNPPLIGQLYTVGSTSITLQEGHGARLPANGVYWVRFANTIKRVTARTGDVLTVDVAAADGTTDADAPGGTEVHWIIGPAALNQLRSDPVREMTWAQFKALTAGEYRPGDLVCFSDSPYTARRGVSSWSYFLGGWKIPRLADDSEWAWTTRGANGSADSSHGGLILVSPANNGVVAKAKALPGSTHTFVGAFNAGMSAYQYSQTGIGLRDASTGRSVRFAWINSFGHNQLEYTKWNSDTSWNSTYNAWNMSAIRPLLGLVMMRFVVDATNRHVDLCTDGYNWQRFYTISNTDWCTPTHAMIYLNGSAQPETVYYHSLELT